MIKLEAVSLTYKSKDRAQQIFDCLSLTVAQGERLAVIGPSGCGKSSLLGLLSGLIVPDSGKVYYHDAPLTKPHREIAVILQEYGLFPWKNVRKNVELPLALQHEGRSARYAPVEEVLAQVGLAGEEEKYPAQLSGGQRQRVAIARALVSRPRALLMDEPFSALDAINREYLQNLILRLAEQEGITLVMVTHNIEEAVFLGQRILVFDRQGGLHWVDNPESGRRNYREQPEFHQKCSRLREMIGGGL